MNDEKGWNKPAAKVATTNLTPTMAQWHLVKVLKIFPFVKLVERT